MAKSLKDLLEEARAQGDGNYMIRLEDETHLGHISVKVKDGEASCTPLDILAKQWLSKQEKG
jgi:hypothetical protein